MENVILLRPLGRRSITGLNGLKLRRSPHLTFGSWAVIGDRS